MSLAISQPGKTEAVIIIKAAPQVGTRSGETVCCAAIDIYGKWHRLYPVSFRHLDDGQKFGRWDRVEFRWRTPKDDPRIESRRIDQHSLKIIGQIKESERSGFLAKSIVTSLENERKQGRSLALLKAHITDFRIEPKTDSDILEQKAKFDSLRAQPDLLNTKPLIPYSPCPYKFKYRYRTDDGIREGTCQDWEIEATFFKWSKQYGENAALEMMKQRFGEEYPRKGMLLAMGTHSQYPDTWLINGIIRFDDTRQLSLF